MTISKEEIFAEHTLSMISNTSAYSVKEVWVRICHVFFSFLALEGQQKITSSVLEKVPSDENQFRAVIWHFRSKVKKTSFLLLNFLSLIFYEIFTIDLSILSN